MRRLLQIIATLMLAACSADTTDTAQLPDNPGSGLADSVAVGFSARLTDAAVAGTRAEEYTGYGVMNTDRLKLTGFGVYCWYTGTTSFDNWASHSHIKDYTVYELMRNQKVEWDATADVPAWTYSPAKYWPLKNDEMLTLRAYAPYIPYMVLTPQEVVETQGTPYLPVIVRADDYCRNRQQDPLWGTSRHDEGGDAVTRDPDYGLHYDNYTYAMSGTDLVADERDGIIDWYFHHGMAMFALQATLAQEDPNTEVRLTGVHTGPFYNEGLLDIFNSPTEKAGDAPIWRDRSHPAADDFYVDIAYQHPNDPDNPTAGTHNDLLNNVLHAGVYQNVAMNGMLVIPRDFSVGQDMLLRVTYTETNKTTGNVVTKSAEAHLNLNVVGNVVYWLQLTLNVEDNTLLVRSFLNLHWQVCTYDLIDGL